MACAWRATAYGIEYALLGQVIGELAQKGAITAALWCLRPAFYPPPPPRRRKAKAGDCLALLLAAGSFPCAVCGQAKNSFFRQFAAGTVPGSPAGLMQFAVSTCGKGGKPARPIARGSKKRRFFILLHLMACVRSGEQLILRVSDGKTAIRGTMPFAVRGKMC